MDPIDLLTLAIITWCGHDQMPKQYTKVSIEKCAETIYDCAINDQGKASSKNEELIACSKKGKQFLIPIRKRLP